MRPNTIPLNISDEVDSFSIAPETLFRIGGPRWNYFQSYRVDSADKVWHGKLAEKTGIDSVQINQDIARSLQIAEGDETTIQISSADPVKTVEYEIVENVQSSLTICEGVEIKEDKICTFQGRSIKIKSCSVSPGYVTSNTMWKRLAGQQESGGSSVSSLGGKSRNKKPGFARLAGKNLVIEEIRQRILLPIQQPDLASRFDVTPVNGVLLTGPAGVGKKTVAKAISEELKWKPLWISRRDIFNPAALQEKLNAANSKNNGALILIVGLDEIDPSVFAERRALSTIHQFFAGTTNNNHVLTIGLAENKRKIAPKLKGVGRFEFTICLPKPNRLQRAELFEEFLLPVGKADCTFDHLDLADQSEGLTGEDIKHVVQEAKIQVMIEAQKSSTDQKITTNTILEILRKNKNSQANNITNKTSTLKTIEQ